MDDKQNNMTGVQENLGSNPGMNGSAPVTTSTSTQNVNGAAQSPQMSEAQAKALLAEETRKTQAMMQPHNRKTKGILLIVGIVLLVMLVMGVGFAVLFHVMKSSTEVGQVSTSETSTDNEPQEESKDNSEEKPQDTPEEQLVALDINDGLVQGVWKNFEKLSFSSPLEQLKDFYADSGVLTGNVPEIKMLDIAMQLVPTTTCKISEGDAELHQRYDKYFTNLAYPPTADDYRWMRSEGCYDGRALKDKIAEIFGKDVQLSENLLAQGRFYQYDSGLDEVFVANMGRGGIYPVYNRTLQRAEKDDNRVYIYEEVSVSVPGTEGISVNDACIGGVKQCESGESYEMGVRNFKWTFVKNSDGNYVFEKLENV